MGNEQLGKRIREISSVFLKHGFKKGIGNPKQLRLALEELGSSFIKIGQMLSTRTDLLPIEYTNELQKLQDNVKPQDFSIMKDAIEHELGATIGDVFSEFEESPIAAASVSQVHVARLKTGEKVVIKIQTPSIKEKMLTDIRILRKLTALLDLTSNKDTIDLNKVVDELKYSLENELNFLTEMENIITFTKNNEDIKYITIPKVYKKYCTEKMVVMDYISGIKINNIEELKREGYDLHDIAIKITYNYFKQVFEDGFFHADPHPGNILIHNNTIGYIDFGLMGTLSINLRNKLNDLLEGLATNNIEKMTDSIIAFGVKTGEVNKDKLYSDLEIFLNTYLNESIHDFDLSKLLEDILAIVKNNNIGIPSDITLLSKAILTFQGIVANLDDEMTLMDVAKPYFKNRILSTKLKEIDLNQLAILLYSSAKSGVQIPNKLTDVLDSAKKGKLKLNLKLEDENDTIDKINKMVNRLIIAIVVAGLLVSSSLVINANVGPNVYGISALGILGYIGAGLAGLLLLISIFKSGKL